MFSFLSNIYTGLWNMLIIEKMHKSFGANFDRAKVPQIEQIR